MEVVDTGPVVREWIDAVWQRVRVNRDQYVGVVQLGEVRAGIELDWCGVGTGQQDRRARRFEQRLRLLRDGERCDGLPQARRSLGAEGRMAGIEHNRATGQRTPRVNHGRPPNFEYQVAPAP